MVVIWMKWSGIFRSINEVMEVSLPLLPIGRVAKVSCSLGAGTDLALPAGKPHESPPSSSSASSLLLAFAKESGLRPRDRIIFSTCE